MTSRFTTDLQQSRQHGTGGEKKHKSLAWDVSPEMDPCTCSQLVLDG